jgi:hypothetical protein
MTFCETICTIVTSHSGFSCLVYRVSHKFVYFTFQELQKVRTCYRVIRQYTQFSLMSPFGLHLGVKLYSFTNCIPAICFTSLCNIITRCPTSSSALDSGCLANSKTAVTVSR